MPTQEYRKLTRDFTGRGLSQDRQQVFVEQVRQVLSHLLGPGARLHGRERLPEIGKALDRVSLMNELARELLDVIGKLLPGLVLRHCGGTQGLLLLLAYGSAEGVREVEM